MEDETIVVLGCGHVVQPLHLPLGRKAADWFIPMKLTYRYRYVNSM